VHKILNLSLAALVVAHVGAALKHHLVDRDDILSRMLPLRKRRQECPPTKTRTQSQAPSR
jgi:cytochrome b561